VVGFERVVSTRSASRHAIAGKVMRYTATTHVIDDHMNTLYKCARSQLIERNGNYLVCQRAAHKASTAVSLEFPGARVEPAETHFEGGAQGGVAEELDVRVLTAAPRYSRLPIPARIS